MASLTVSRSGPVPPGRAWERYARPDLWSGWAPHITRVETDADRIAPGTRGRVWSWCRVRVRFEVDEVDEARGVWTWRARMGPLVLFMRHEVAPDGRGGTRTRLTMNGPLPVIALYRPLASLALGRLVTRD